MSTCGLLRHISGAFVAGNQIKHGGREVGLASFGARHDFILSIVRQLDGGNVSEDMTDYLAFRLDQLYGHILRLTASNPNLREVEPLICEAARCLRNLVGMSSNDCYELPLEHSRHVGRPRFGVSIAQLEYLLQNDFTSKQISEMLSIFLSTVRRRMRDFNLSVRDPYSSFSEEELDNALQSILRDFCPEDGLNPNNVMCSWRLV